MASSLFTFVVMAKGPFERQPICRPLGGVYHFGNCDTAACTRANRSSPLSHTVDPLFLGIPRTGQVFCQAARMYGGQEYLYFRRQSGHHAPLNETDVESTLALFRRPEDLLISMYEYVLMSFQRRFPCCDIRWGWRAKTVARVRRMARDGVPADRVMAAPEYRGCQLNMLLGARCLSGHFANASQHVQQAAIAKAERIVDRLLFVGIHERWFESVCLFNWRMTGTLFWTKEQLRRVHAAAVQPPPPSETRSKPLEPRDQVRARMPRDQLDAAVYARALARFERDLAAAPRIDESTCAQVSLMQPQRLCLAPCPPGGSSSVRRQQR